MARKGINSRIPMRHLTANFPHHRLSFGRKKILKRAKSSKRMKIKRVTDREAYK